MTESVLDDELILRRFDPADPQHFITIDEGSSPLVARLAAGALRFDDDGCSVFRLKTLEDSGLSALSITTRRHPSVAQCDVARIRSFEFTVAGSGEVFMPFDVVADPIETDPEDLTESAHALIIETIPQLSRNQKKKSRVRLAQIFEIA